MNLLPISRHEPFTPISAKAFRRQVLRPVEGVFLFHHRALERLVREHQDQGLLSRQVPQLSYYLIPRQVFLVALEDENPEALSVIEGIDLPQWVILLPTPLASKRVTTSSRRLLYQYWARRFEAEVARAWQQARDADHGQPRFGAEGLEHLLGSAAMEEIRGVLERDRMMLLEQDDHAVIRQFVGLVARLRYFAPALRTLWFPAIRDWRRLDEWVSEAGLDLLPLDPAHPARLPRLLLRSRPQNLNIGLQPGPELPQRLEYPCTDPDNTPKPVVCPNESLQRPEEAGSDAPLPARSALQRFCLNALDRPPPKMRTLALPGVLANWAGRLVGRVWYRIQPHPAGSEGAPPGPRQRRIRAAAFHRVLQAAKDAEAGGHLARAMRRVVEASWQYRRLAAEWSGPSDPVLRRLDARLEHLSRTLADAGGPAWGADPEQRNTLRELLHGIARAQVEQGRLRAGNRLVHHLEQAIGAARTEYLGLRLWPWLRARGRRRLRRPLPYQSRLKALRALDAAIGELDNLPWDSRRIEYYRVPLAAARDTLGQQIATQLGPPLDAAMAAVGMEEVADHRQAVALQKLKAELLDVVSHRYHLRFSDVRDAMARNDFPLDDLKPREYLVGDRLGRIDHQLAKRLPGFYRRAEVYLKGLHRLSSWLFGSAAGRLFTRYLLMPFGAALVLLVVVDHVVPLFSSAETVRTLTSPWSVLGLGLVLNALFHTRWGRETMASLGRGIGLVFTLVVFQGIRTLLNWGPVARLLRNPTVRELSRYLLEPLAIGLLTLVPLAALVLWLLPEKHGMPWEVFALGFVLGSFLRNTQRGRRILDAAMAQLMLFWSQVRHTLVSGLLRLVVDFFKNLLDGFEQMLYRLEELARYRAGEPLGTALVKTALRPVGTSLSYVARFYVTVLVEPQVNPIKHFPVVTVSHKMILPALPALTSGMLTVLDPVVPRVISLPFVTATVLLLPGFFGFLVWELKENWKLFGANRARTVQPVLVGHHGENLRVMLRRGFHAGTVPKAFDRLRRVLRKARDSGITPRVKLRKAEAPLLRNQHEIARLQQRELIASLRQLQRNGQLESIDRVECGAIYMATSSVEMHILLHLQGEGSREAIELLLHFAVTGDELQGMVETTGPLDRVPRVQRERIADQVIEFFARCAAQTRGRELQRVFSIDGAEAGTNGGANPGTRGGMD